MSTTLKLMLAEGESKVMKTSVASVAAVTLRQKGLRVIQADAGSFFRKVTVAAWEILEKQGITEPTVDDFAAASKAVLAARTPYDSTRDWSGIHGARIDHAVGTVSFAKHVQDASLEWWNETADQALKAGIDVLILDGRNPRARMQQWMQAHGVQPTLELFCMCDVPVAAERTLLGRGIINPTNEQKVHEQAAIASRRQEDRNRTSLPYTDPVAFVDFAPGMDAAEVVKAAQAQSSNGAPLPIRLDTTQLERSVMDSAVQAVVTAAFALD